MRVMRKTYVKQTPAAIEQHRAAVLAYIDAQSGEAIEFADVRASFPAAKRKELTDGLIHQICLDAGMTVEA